MNWENISQLSPWVMALCALVLMKSAMLDQQRAVRIAALLDVRPQYLQRYWNTMRLSEGWACGASLMLIAVWAMNLSGQFAGPVQFMAPALNATYIVFFVLWYIKRRHARTLKDSNLGVSAKE